MSAKPRIALIISHPIQHFCPQYVSFAQNNDIVFKVFFASMLGLKKYIDANFKREISWGNLQLEKFDHVFLNGDVVIPSDKHIDAPDLEKELETFAPDVVITYGYFQKLQRRAYSWSKRNNVSLAYISDSERRQKRSILVETIKYPFLRRYFSAIDHFLTVGDANEAFYRYYGVPKNKMIRMHFPIDVACYEKSFEDKTILSEKIRQQYGIGNNEFVMSVVGKLVPWKNQDHIIEAMKLLEAQGIYLHLFVVGSGEMQEVWQQKAEFTRSWVHFTGFINIEALPAYYAASNCYVHPASAEPHSIAVSEAIYMGCPIILSDNCGSYGDNDDVQEGRNGFVYPFGDIHSLAEKIKWMVLHPEECMEYGNYSHEIAVAFQEKAHRGVITELNNKLRVHA